MAGDFLPVAMFFHFYLVAAASGAEDDMWAGVASNTCNFNNFTSVLTRTQEVDSTNWNISKILQKPSIQIAGSKNIQH